MKTAEDWVKERATTKGVLGNLTVDIARSIQADALREAAEIAGRNMGDGMWDVRKEIRDAILDKAKELELHR